MKYALSDYLMKSEAECVQGLLDTLIWDDTRAAKIRDQTVARITAMRGAKRKAGSIEGFFQSYGLDTQEGIALMCLAEALLRVPDSKTADRLIEERLRGLSWDGDDAQDDWIMRMAALGLNATRATLESPLARLGEPVIRAAMTQGMKILGGQFVMGQDIKEALKAAQILHHDKGYSFSFDMLGEGARTYPDAQTYFESYQHALSVLKDAGQGSQHGISVKLSALHPRYQVAQEDVCVPDVSQKIIHLAGIARAGNIILTIDAEESERLELSLKIIRAVMKDPVVKGWDGFGLAIQAYSKRALPLIETMIEEVKSAQQKIHIRLVKGAYWDSEIKRAQMKGLVDYPLFTRKHHTDLSYLTCAQVLLNARDVIYPMFGTHNAYTVEAILEMAAGREGGFEFQRLFGMGDILFDQIREEERAPVRIYAPVGIHKDLLPYLVRRLLENGANSSFVNKAFDAHISPSFFGRDPVARTKEEGGIPHPDIKLPSAIFTGRTNAQGLDLDDTPTRQRLLQAIQERFNEREKKAFSIIDGRMDSATAGRSINNPADRSEEIGYVHDADEALIAKAFQSAQKSFPVWSRVQAQERARILNAIAHLYEQNRDTLMALCIHEAGKTIPDALAEVREAVDFCRYYAQQGIRDFDENGRVLESYTGEENRLSFTPRGVFVCISPWNFPLAIFTGQIVAALMAGNTVIAKPAEQTPFIAQAAVKLMHKAGIPTDTLHLLQGDGRVGEKIVQHKGVCGVAFTGSSVAARAINQTLAAKEGAIVPLIAETGGQNVMIADSTCLSEQVVDDVIIGAFASAGQRCSATRVLCIQDDVADGVLTMLKGAMENLILGDPRFYKTDIGPVIDEEALQRLQQHKSRLEGIGTLIAQSPLPEHYKVQGHFFAPVAYQIHSLSDLTEEVFGPILHVVKFKAQDLPKLYEEINQTGYGLTFGMHTRLQNRAYEAARAVNAGNVYINRSMIGAVVGVQPFGGNGLSGTGPKAGGPNYLHRFANEKTISINTTASGGNTSLVMLGE